MVHYCANKNIIGFEYSTSHWLLRTEIWLADLGDTWQQQQQQTNGAKKQQKMLVHCSHSFRCSWCAAHSHSRHMKFVRFMDISLVWHKNAYAIRAASSSSAENCVCVCVCSHAHFSASFVIVIVVVAFARNLCSKLNPNYYVIYSNANDTDNDFTKPDRF